MQISCTPEDNKLREEEVERARRIEEALGDAEIHIGANRQSYLTTFTPEDRERFDKIISLLESINEKLEGVLSALCCIDDKIE